MTQTNAASDNGQDTAQGELEPSAQNLDDEASPNAAPDYDSALAETLHQQTIAYQGPLPPPGALEHYNRISPGAADRIIAMAEREAQHRHEMERKQLELDEAETRRGQHFGFIIGLSAIVAGSLTSIMGEPWSGGFIGTGGVIGLVAVFVLGRKLTDSNNQ